VIKLRVVRGIETMNRKEESRSKRDAKVDGNEQRMNEMRNVGGKKNIGKTDTRQLEVCLCMSEK